MSSQFHQKTNKTKINIRPKTPKRILLISSLLTWKNTETAKIETLLAQYDHKDGATNISQNETNPSDPNEESDSSRSRPELASDSLGLVRKSGSRIDEQGQDITTRGTSDPERNNETFMSEVIPGGGVKGMKQVKSEFPLKNNRDSVMAKRNGGGMGFNYRSNQSPEGK